MSDLAATGCGNNDCGCGNNMGLFGGGDCCSLIWIILLISCFGGNGCGNNLFSNNGSSCDLLILILLISCFSGNGFNNNCGCC